jgi:DnaJ-class molecular chaperone
MSGPMGSMGVPHRNQMSDIIQLSETVDLRDVCVGKHIERVIERASMCQLCDGIGFDDHKFRPCSVCDGKKIIFQQFCLGPMVHVNQSPCVKCNGTGSDTSSIHVCHQCRGHRIYQEKYTLQYDLPIGQTESDPLILKNMGNIHLEDLQDGLRGPILIRLIITPNNKFMRGVNINGKIRLSPYDLLVRVNINLAESLCGFTRVIEHPCGETITICPGQIIRDTDIYVISDKGIPKENKNGDLYVIFDVETPNEIDQHTKKVLWELLTNTPYIDNNKTPTSMSKFQI